MKRLFVNTLATRDDWKFVVWAMTASLSAFLSSVTHADTLRIGISAPLTGIQAQAGKDVVAHLQSGLEDLLQRGEFGAHHVELIVLDDGYDVKRTENNVRQLVQEKRVHLLMNQIGSAHAAAAVPIMQASGVTLFAPLSGPRGLYAESLRPAVVPLRASYADEVQQQIKSLAATGIQSVSVIYQDDAFGQDVLQSWTEEVKNTSLKIASVHPLPRGSDAVAPLVDAALQSNPSAIVLAVVSTPALSAAKRIRAIAGSRVYPVMMSVAATSEVIEALSGSDTRGTVLFSSVMPVPTGGSNRLSRNYSELRKKYGLKPSFRGLEAYVSLLIVAEHVKRIPRVSAQSIGNALAAAPGFAVKDVYLGMRKSRYADVFAISKKGLL